MPYKAIRSFKASGKQYLVGDPVDQDVVDRVGGTLLGSKYIAESETQAPSNSQLITASAPAAPAAVAGLDGVDLDAVVEEIESAEPETSEEEAAVTQQAINESAVEETAATPEETEGASDANATAAAKEEAEELGVDLKDVKGTGARGRITQEDVRRTANEQDQETS